MPKNDPKAQIKLNKSVLTSVLKNYGLTLESFSVPKNGIENTTVLLKTNKGKYVLRVYRKNRKNSDEVLLELKFMSFLQNHNLPVPKIFPNSTGSLITKFKANNSIWKCILMQHMTGGHPKAYSDTLIADLAITQAKMHKLGIKFAHKKPHGKILNTLKEGWFIKRIQINKLKDQEIINFLKRAEKFVVNLDPKLPHGFNHLDYDHGNILAKNNRLTAILDFDDLAYSPTAICLGYTLWAILATSEDKKKVVLYLEHYTKIRKLSLLEKKSMNSIILFRNYVIGAFAVLFFGENDQRLPAILRLENKLLKFRGYPYEGIIL